MATFENIGYFVEYLIDTKLIGTTVISEPDREEVGYNGTKHEVAQDDILLQRGKKIKKGTKYYTRLYPLCGKLQK